MKLILSLLIFTVLMGLNLNNSVSVEKSQAVQAVSEVKVLPLPKEKALTEQQAVPKQAVAVQEPIKVPEPTPKDLARSKAAQRGWVGKEWEALEDLWHKESNWNPHARNKSSGACGIPQSWPCSKIPNPESVESQIDWGLGYIATRYGSPSKALAFWKYRAPKINGSNWY